MLVVVQFVGCLVCAAALNLGQFVVWAAAVVWAALTTCLGTGVVPVHVAVQMSFGSAAVNDVNAAAVAVLVELV